MTSLDPIPVPPPLPLPAIVILPAESATDPTMTPQDLHVRLSALRHPGISRILVIAGPHRDQVCRGISAAGATRIGQPTDAPLAALLQAEPFGKQGLLLLFPNAPLTKKTLTAFTARRGSCLGVHPAAPSAAAPIGVGIANQRIVRFERALPPDKTQGAFAGIARLDTDAAQALFAAAEWRLQHQLPPPDIESALADILTACEIEPFWIADRLSSTDEPRPGKVLTA